MPHLVNLRIAQINGCFYCIEMHSRDALQLWLAHRNRQLCAYRCHGTNGRRQGPEFIHWTL
ncbi:carboxymuconolactone decarboxylase family protein [Nitratireductor sp. OM-1]|uniref:carboxymuconolactone decarboxylase family protein n=1 Tax=Nitratireductor sp. OM-1 TaxID=1756988 RepID=UPI000DE08596